jgi:hypothetical protein
VLSLCAASIDGLDLDEVMSVLSDLEKVIGKKSKKEKESSFSYTGLPFKSSSTSAAAGAAPTTSTPPTHLSRSSSAGKEEEKEMTKVATEARRLAMMAQITPVLYPSSMLFRSVAIQKVVEGGVEGKAGEEQEEGAGEEGKERKSSGGVVDHEPEEQEKKLEVASKYLFVHGMLKKLLAAAEHVSTHRTVRRRTLHGHTHA